MNPAFFMPGMTTTQRALSIKSWGIPLSEALIISVSVSAEAFSLSSTLIALSAAKAALLREPAIARTQTQCFEFILIKKSSPLSFVLKPGFRFVLSLVVEWVLAYSQYRLPPASVPKNRRS
jgi:hypothetical protein